MFASEQLRESFRQMIHFHSESCESAAVVWEHLMWLTAGRIGSYFFYASCCDDIVSLDAGYHDSLSDITCWCDLADSYLLDAELADCHAERRGYPTDVVYLAEEGLRLPSGTVCVWSDGGGNYSQMCVSHASCDGEVELFISVLPDGEDCYNCKREIDEAFVYIAAEHMTNQELAEFRDRF